MGGDRQGRAGEPQLLTMRRPCKLHSHVRMQFTYADADARNLIYRSPAEWFVPPVGFEPTLRTLLGGRPLPLGYGGALIVTLISLSIRPVRTSIGAAAGARYFRFLPRYSGVTAERDEATAASMRIVIGATSASSMPTSVKLTL